MRDIELPPLPEPDICRYVVTVWRDGVECEIDKGPRYTVEQMQAYARAAVEADRAQRVPDGWVLIATDAYEAGFGKGEQAHKTGKDVENPWGDEPGREAWAMGYALGKERAASTPVPAPTPAQQEPTQRKLSAVDLAKAATKEQFRHYHEVMAAAQHQEPPQQEHSNAEKLAVAIAEAATKVGITDAASHSFSGPQLLMLLDDMVEMICAKPQQERKPMTYREIAAATSEWAHVRSDYTIGIIRAAERHHGIKE